MCLGSWELNCDLNTVPLHVRHSAWNHGLSEWCHNERDGIWNHWRLDCLLSRLFKHRPKKTTTPRVIGLCEGKSTIWWRHHATRATVCSHDSSHYQRMKPQSSTFMVLCVGNTRISSEFSVQRVINNESVSISWRHHGMEKLGIRMACVVISFRLVLSCAIAINMLTMVRRFSATLDGIENSYHNYPI